MLYSPRLIGFLINFWIAMQDYKSCLLFYYQRLYWNIGYMILNKTHMLGFKCYFILMMTVELDWEFDTEILITSGSTLLHAKIVFIVGLSFLSYNKYHQKCCWLLQGKHTLQVYVDIYELRLENHICYQKKHWEGFCRARENKDWI